jgi:hypothetical protein
MDDDARSPVLASPSREHAANSLRNAGAYLIRDLRAVFDGTWRLQVDDDLVMSVAWGERSESVQLGAPLSEAEWLRDEGWFEESGLPAGQDLEDLLDEVALEYLAAELSEVLAVWGYDSPACPVHDRPLGACGREWFCDGPPAHSLPIGEIADLSADEPALVEAGNVPLRVPPSQSGQWTDEAGTLWRLRGAGPGVGLKRLEHLLTDDAVRVVLLDGPGPPADVPPAKRPALWTRMQPYLRGKVDRAQNDQAEFVIGEFKDPARRSLVVIEEHC